MKGVFILLLLFGVSLCSAQMIEITPFSDNQNDSVFLKHLSYFAFDTFGNYVAVNWADSFSILKRVDHTMETIDTIKEKYDFSETWPIGPPIAYFKFKNNKFYLKHPSNLKLLGPYEIIGSVIASPGGEHMAVVDDNEDLDWTSEVKQKRSEIIKRHYIDDSVFFLAYADYSFSYDYKKYGWCAINAVGEVIFCKKENEKYYLFVNQTLKDSSSVQFTHLAINNSGAYAYVKRCSDSLYLHKDKSTFGPFITAIGTWDKIQFHLGNDGNYFYNIPDKSGMNWIINDKALRQEVGFIAFPDNGQFMRIYKDSFIRGTESYPERNYLTRSGTYFNDFANSMRDSPYLYEIKGITHRTSYTKLFCPIMDTGGNFAFCGQRGYYIYRNVNGRELPDPISKYGVRAKVLSISIAGSTVHTFTTRDSVYLYNDEHLLYKAANGKERLKIIDAEKLISSAQFRTFSASVYGIVAGDKMYLVYNGILSQPFQCNAERVELTWPNISVEFSSPARRAIHNIVQGNGRGDNFYFIEDMEKEGFDVFVNNRKVAVLKNNKMDAIRWTILEAFYLDDHQFIFYGLKKGKVYRYKIKL